MERIARSIKVSLKFEEDHADLVEAFDWYFHQSFQVTNDAIHSHLIEILETMHNRHNLPEFKGMELKLLALNELANLLNRLGNEPDE